MGGCSHTRGPERVHPEGPLPETRTEAAREPGLDSGSDETDVPGKLTGGEVTTPHTRS